MGTGGVGRQPAAERAKEKGKDSRWEAPPRATGPRTLEPLAVR